MARRAKPKNEPELISIVFLEPEGDDWKPAGWRIPYEITAKKLIALAVARLEEENNQQATLSKDPTV